MELYHPAKRMINFVTVPKDVTHKTPILYLSHKSHILYVKKNV